MTITAPPLGQALYAAGIALLVVYFLAGMAYGLLSKLNRQTKLITELYLKGCWRAEGVSAHDAATIWQRVRDEFGIPKGTATSLGVGDPKA